MGLNASSPSDQEDQAPVVYKRRFPKFKPTEEQQYAVDLALKGFSVAVAAYAGAGKTSTEQEISEAILEQEPMRVIHYFAFSKAMANEAQDKFSSRVRVSTAHSLAYQSTVDGVRLGQTFRDRLKSGKELRDAVIDRHKGMIQKVQKYVPNEYTAVSDVLDTVRNFSYSDSEEITTDHVPYDHKNMIASMSGDQAAKDYTKAVTQAAQKVWKDMSSLQGKFPATHDTYLKIWAMKGDFSQFDLVLFDEAQDANPVMLSALKKMEKNGAQIILVGDQHQSIFGWRGAIDAMNAFPDFEQAHLTESFRFGQNIADAAQLFLTAAGEKIPLKGRNPHPGIHRDGPNDPSEPIEPDVILCRSNAGVITSALEYIAEGKTPYIEGGAQDAAKLLIALKDLYHIERKREGQKRAFHPELILFKTFAEVEEYASSKEGGSLKPFVNLSKKLIATGEIDNAIDALLNGTTENRHDADISISTVHKAKGLEWDNVLLGGDWDKTSLFTEHTYLDEEGFETQAYSLNKENYKLLYVAWTRAKNALDTNGLQYLYTQQAQAIIDYPLTPEIEKRVKDYENTKQVYTHSNHNEME